MSILQLKSDNINTLCESLQRLSLVEDNIKTSDITKKDDKFSVDVNTNDADNIKNYLDPSIDVEDKSPEEEKAQIEIDFKNSIKQLLDTADIINDILKRSAEYQKNYKEELSDDWVISTSNNDISIPKRNAHLFRQNKNICLSHDNEIEIFNNITELKAYLKKNEYPELTDEMIHQLKEASNEEILNLLKESVTEVIPASALKVGDIIYNPITNSKETYVVTNIQNGFISAHNSDNYGSDVNFKADETPITKITFDNVEECCGGVTTGSIAPAAVYTVPAKDKKKK